MRSGFSRASVISLLAILLGLFSFAFAAWVSWVPVVAKGGYTDTVLVLSIQACRLSTAFLLQMEIREELADVFGFNLAPQLPRLSIADTSIRKA